MQTICGLVGNLNEHRPFHFLHSRILKNHIERITESLQKFALATIFSTTACTTFAKLYMYHNYMYKYV